MPVVTYDFDGFNDAQTLDVTPVTGAIEITGLSNGGFVGIGDVGGTVTGMIFDASGARTGTFAPNIGVNGSIDQLGDGNLVIASENGGVLSIKIVNSVTGADVVASFAGLPGVEPDVMALSGGRFAIVSHSPSGLGNGVYLDIYDSSGTHIVSNTVDANGDDSRNPSITQLAGGNIVVAWTRTVGGETEVWQKIISAAGADVFGPALVDTAGTLNKHVSVTVLQGGGYAMVYEDNEFSGANINITLATFDEAGVSTGAFNIAQTTTVDIEPSVTLLANGLLAVCSNRVDGGLAFIKLVDPATGAVLAERDVIGGPIGGTVEDAVAAVFSAGRIAVFYNDVTGSLSYGSAMNVVRHSVVDEIFAETVTGDDFIDDITGGNGEDTLNGAGGNDIITGGGSFDTLTGGNGDDTFVYLASADLAAGESINGGAGTGDEIVVKTDFEVYDFRTSTITGVEKLTFEGLHSVDLTGTQIGAGAITQVTGDGEFNQIRVFGAAVNLSGVNFTVWTDGADGISINGTAGADSLTGSDRAGVFFGDGGADALTGGAGDDTFSYVVGAELAAGEVISGGAGTGDAIQFLDSASYNLALATITGVEQLRFSGVGGTASLLGTQIGAGQIASVFGDGGVNTLNVSGAAANLSGVAFTDWTDGTDIININGTAGADNLTGSGKRDIISAGALDDSLNGGGGADSMFGGLGNDNYYVDNAGDTTSEAGGGGIGDYVLTTVSFTAAAGIERLYLQGAGNINAIGRDAQADFLLGNSGNNGLDGRSGADLMRGGLGNDNYYVDNIADVTDETIGGGGVLDQVFATVSYTAAAGIERLTLQGAANINATGRDAQADFLIGNSGNNVVDGRGGIDTMRGGLGNDTYYVDNIADVTDEVTGGGGIGDYVLTTVSFTAAAGIERIYLQGASNINATGRDGQVDFLLGNSGNNVLDGKGGIDTMRGGLGNDTYYVDNSADVTDETTGGGGIGDYVFASASFTAAAGIERIYLQGGTNINATGRDGQVDFLLGNSGNNVLDGKGGIDTMRGGLGNDTYYVDNAADVTDEVTGGGGIGDYVFASVSHTAAAGIERIYLQGATGINATGRDGQVDYLIGNSGDNILNGKGGNDNLQGNAGQDTYRFDTAPNAATNQDQIIGFSSVDDKIELDNAVFTALGLATGPLAASMFQIGAAANDIFDRIIYNNATGALLYDADGNGGGAAIQFASLTGAPALALGDLFVI